MHDITTYRCESCRHYTAVQADCDPGLCPDCGAAELTPRAVASPVVVVRELLAGNVDFVIRSLRGETVE